MIVLPDQRNKLQWDAGISMVCVLVAVLSPYRMAFASIDARRWLAFDAIVDICFVIGENIIHPNKRGVRDNAPPEIFKLIHRGDTCILRSPFSTCDTSRDFKSTTIPGGGHRWVEL